MTSILLISAIILLGILTASHIREIKELNAEIQEIKKTADIAYENSCNLIEDVLFLSEVINNSHEDDIRVQQYNISRLEEKVKSLEIILKKNEYAKK